MKKILVLPLLMLLFLVGCDQNKNTENDDQISDTMKVMTCTMEQESDDVEVTGEYKVYYEGDYVQLIKTTEIVKSSDSNVLQTYKDFIEGMYSIYDDVEHYDYNISVSANTLTSTTNIDYSKIDTDKMIEIESSNASFIKDGKIDIDDIEDLYNSMNITCTK